MRALVVVPVCVKVKTKIYFWLLFSSNPKRAITLFLLEATC